jgi:Na+-translocating ferredoxin:NAD+ oxidoreductase RnfC subunit
VRQRWFGATGTRVPEIAVEGDPVIPITAETLVVDDVSDAHSLHAAHVEGRPVVARASTVEGVLAALRRPEVATVLVPESARELLDLDLVSLTYG